MSNGMTSLIMTHQMLQTEHVTLIVSSVVRLDFGLDFVWDRCRQQSRWCCGARRYRRCWAAWTWWSIWLSTAVASVLHWLTTSEPKSASMVAPVALVVACFPWRPFQLIRHLDHLRLFVVCCLLHFQLLVVAAAAVGDCSLSTVFASSWRRHYLWIWWVIENDDVIKMTHEAEENSSLVVSAFPVLELTGSDSGFTGWTRTGQFRSNFLT